MNILGVHGTKSRLDHGSNMANKTHTHTLVLGTAAAAATAKVNVKQKFEPATSNLVII